LGEANAWSPAPPTVDGRTTPVREQRREAGRASSKMRLLLLLLMLTASIRWQLPTDRASVAAETSSARHARLDWHGSAEKCVGQPISCFTSPDQR